MYKMSLVSKEYRVVKEGGTLPPLERGSAGCEGNGAWSVSPRAPVPPQVDGSKR